jgi:hypothetical protein
MGYIFKRNITKNYLHFQKSGNRPNFVHTVVNVEKFVGINLMCFTIAQMARRMNIE